MKFDFCIGNPPYQEETADTSDKPVYNCFMEAAYSVADKVEMITPARFLFNAGKTPKSWNEKMLNDEHFKVSYYEQDSSKVFANTDIMGGVAVTYRDSTKVYGAIGSFSAFNELNAVLKKIGKLGSFESLDDIIVQQNKWDLDELYKDYPEYKSVIGSEGTEKRLTTSIFSALSVFKEKGDADDVRILGLIGNKRVYRYVPRQYIDKTHKSLMKYKVLVPASNGSGAISDEGVTPLIGEPSVGEPNTGFTQSFIGFGWFDNEHDALSCEKYIRTKFARTLLGTLKVTQHNHKGTWSNVPLQDFTTQSDIDWTKSIPEIDQQLYRKYGLSQEEIDFIEKHVKEME